MSDFSGFVSPFSWRYGSQEMRHIWSEQNKRILWRKIWLALATAQAEYGLVQSDQVQDLQVHANQVDLNRSLEIEAEIKHDLMAELKAFAEQCPSGGGILHLGATSADIEDNADAIRIRDSLTIVEHQLHILLQSFSDQIEAWADLVVMGYTHLQPAEPTTLGYRLAFTAEDLLASWQEIKHMTICGKGFKGAVGAAAAYTQLIGDEHFPAFETHLERLLGIPFFPVTSQVSPRRQEYQVISSLSSIAASLHKFTLDLRLLQSPLSAGISEPFEKNQIGSSAMPFKRNPIQSEKIDSLTRQLAQFPRLAWDNMAFSALERTLDDSANRRTLLPEAFLIMDEVLRVAQRLIAGLVVDEDVLKANLSKFAPFSAIEPILMELVRSGANRQEMHARLREHAMHAWESNRLNSPNPLVQDLTNDPHITRFLSATKITELINITTYLGIAPQRAKESARRIRDTLQQGL